jgi:hypothetical protein
MSAGAQIVKQDGLIVAASKCNDGFPAHGNFKLFEHKTPQAILDTIPRPIFALRQWEAQLLAMIALARVGLYSDIPRTSAARALSRSPIWRSSRSGLARIGKDAPIAALPERADDDSVFAANCGSYIRFEGHRSCASNCSRLIPA